MNLAYLEFIGAVEIDRSTSVVTPKIEPINNRPYHYLEINELDGTIDSLKKALKQAKQEQIDAIRYVYNEIADMVEKTDSNLREGYISKRIIEKNPRWVVNHKEEMEGTNKYARGDICFYEDKIVIFVDYCTINLLDKLRDKYSNNIELKKGILTSDPIEIHIIMEE